MTNKYVINNVDNYNKYIITNCPALLASGICNGRNVKGLACKNNTDCLLKQIVKTCKEVIDNNFMCLGMNVVALDVLRLLEIQECE